MWSLDGSDNFETRYLYPMPASSPSKPLVTAALGMFDGTLTTIRAHENERRRRIQSDLSLPVSRDRRRRARCPPALKPA